MNELQRGMTALLRAAITGQPQPLPQGFQLNDVYPVALRQSVIPLVYEGALLCGVSPADPAMQKLFPLYCKSLAISETQLREVARVCAAFEVAGIDYMPLKGVNMKALYPKPELRSMGDADILIRMEQYPSIVPILESLGYTHKLESDHEIAWRTKGLYLELHKRLLPMDEEIMGAYCGDGWHMAADHSGHCWRMRPEQEFIFLLSHFVKHFSGRGIGCRQIIDLWLFLCAHPEMDMDALKRELKALQLWDFFKNIRRTLMTWFADGLEDPVTEGITDYIFAGGSFGRNEMGVISRTLTDSRHAPMGLHGRTVYALKQIFPPSSQLRSGYPVLRKAPWLLPGVWAWRLCRRFVDSHAWYYHTRNLRLLKSENLSAREKFLCGVGLEAHF